jgi:type II restriction enzyme
MNLFFETKLVDEYKSLSQKARILSEHWVDNQVYCPNCGNISIDKYANNKPIADFFCSYCKEDYELKSTKKLVCTKVVDGAYQTMIERLQDSNNQNFFFLNYDLRDFEVQNFLVIPKHFFIPEIIDKRKPLSPTARRAGWVGCNILLQSIPQTGKYFLSRIVKLNRRIRSLENGKKRFFCEKKKGQAQRAGF